MKNWCDPMWNDNGRHMLRPIYSEWFAHDDKRLVRYAEEAKRMLSLYATEKESCLSRDEYVWLSERDYVKTNGDYDGQFKAVWQIVPLTNRTIREKLLAVGDHIREKR